jgi:L-lysine exporter family protein LysE/ArgO
MTGIWLSGLAAGMGLIIAIGAQNVFVLTQGMSGRHLIAVPLVCFLCDVALMTLGVGGFASFLATDLRFTAVAAAGGAVFLAVYGFRSLRGAFSDRALTAVSAGTSGLKPVLAATLGVTLLNPHVYLDSVVLMGSLGSRFPTPERWAFLAGALSASLVWFFGLSLFGRILSPVLSRPKVWRVLQIGICALLWSQAFGLGRFAAAAWLDLST